MQEVRSCTGQWKTQTSILDWKDEIGANPERARKSETEEVRGSKGRK